MKLAFAFYGISIMLIFASAAFAMKMNVKEAKNENPVGIQNLSESKTYSGKTKISQENKTALLKSEKNREKCNFRMKSLKLLKIRKTWRKSLHLKAGNFLFRKLAVFAGFQFFVKL